MQNPYSKVRKTIFPFLAAGLVLAVSGASSLNGPAKFLPQKLEGEIFYVPVAQGTDQKMIRSAKSNGLKINKSFYDKYHAPLLAAVRSAAKHRDLSIGDEANLFGWLVIQTHKTNGVGYLWGGDLSDSPKESWSTSGVGFDCSGFVWSVWEAVAPQSVFANNGSRENAQAYRKFGRQVIPPSTVNEAFIEKVRKQAQPGDVLIMPGHICLYGYDPRNDHKAPIVMENGEFWNPLDTWLERNRGKKVEVRSSFDSKGKLLINSARRGRALPPMHPTKPDKSLLIASADNLTKDKKKKDKDEEIVVASATKDDDQPAPLDLPGDETSDKELDKVDQDIKQMMSEVKAFDIASLPAPTAKKSGKNSKPEILKVMTRSAELTNDALEFGVATEDDDFDEIVEYRIRMYGAKNWVVSDRPYFRTAMPGYDGDAILEFQVVDARGASSAAAYCKVKITPRDT